jgi:hypothetical protein
MSIIFINPYTFAAPWTPAQITTAIWLDAANVTLNGSTVSNWSDNSGNGRNLNQATAASQPTWNASGLNSLPTITFDGSNDFLSNASVGAGSITSVTMLAVLKVIAGGATEDILMGVGATGNGNACRAMYRAPNESTVVFTGWASAVASTFNYDIAGGHHIFGMWNTQLNNPDNIRINRDGATPETLTNSANLALTVDGFSVGSLRGGSVGSYYSNIEVGEIIVLYTAVGNTDREKLEGYLAHKWGLTGSLPGGHPYKTTAPTI